MRFRDVFCGNFYITTIGNFSNPALLCCILEMGVDRILFRGRLAVRGKIRPPPDGWRRRSICDEDKVKILSGNAKRVLRM